MVKARKLVIIGLAVGVVVNVLDFIVQGNLLADMYAAYPVFRNTANIVPLLILGDFVSAFVFALTYLTLAGSYTGMASGAKVGLFLGVFASFPTFHFMQLLINGIPYSFAWIATIYGIIWYIIAGAVAGALNK